MNEKIQILLAEAERQSAAPTTADGKSSVASARRQFATSAEAETEFHRLKEKLLDIARWNNESGVSSYALFDENGVEAADRAAEGRFIRITLPASGKHDWVKIVEIQDASDARILTVSPSPDSTVKQDDEKTVSHFFTDDSTNNFCLGREDETLFLFVVGLNEKANTADTKNLLESARNFAAANLSHYLGIQKSEWTTFCENFLETKPVKSE